MTTVEFYPRSAHPRNLAARHGQCNTGAEHAVAPGQLYMTSLEGSMPDQGNRPYPSLTVHASRRMQNRGISAGMIDVVLEYGRRVFTRGAIIYAIGRKEATKFRYEGIKLSDYQGIQVVCSLDGIVLTVYRNNDFRGLRTGLGRGRYTSKR